MALVFRRTSSKPNDNAAAGWWIVIIIPRRAPPLTEEALSLEAFHLGKPAQVGHIEGGRLFSPASVDVYQAQSMMLSS